MMAETFIIHPAMSDQQIKEGINDQTRFVLLFDHYNIPPTSDLNNKRYLDGELAMIDQMIINHPNCLFITCCLSPHTKNLDNVQYIPIAIIDMALNPRTKEVEIDWQKARPKTCNHVGGKPRFARTLTAFWLAKNYDLNQLVYTSLEDTDLSWAKDILNCSPYYEKSHISITKKLKPNWYKITDNVDSRPRPELYDIILPQMKFLSYISLQTDSNSAYPSTRVTEKFCQSLLGGTLPLHLGNHEVTSILKSMQIETFDFIFDHNHLSSLDPYYMTIGGLNNNVELISNHKLVEEVWFQNINILKHNQNLIKNSDYWLEKYSHQIKNIEKSLTLITSGGEIMTFLDNIESVFQWNQKLSHEPFQPELTYYRKT